LIEAYEIAQLVESLFNFSIQSSLTNKSYAQRQEPSANGWQIIRPPARIGIY